MTIALLAPARTLPGVLLRVKTSSTWQVEIGGSGAVTEFSMK